uniref:Uncharacterized protein n=1 Tax=Ditylenchus dipsaci TaxID=166011 RepID=A0A915DJM5_9BILA
MLPGLWQLYILAIIFSLSGLVICFNSNISEELLQSKDTLQFELPFQQMQINLSMHTDQKNSRTIGILEGEKWRMVFQYLADVDSSFSSMLLPNDSFVHDAANISNCDFRDYRVIGLDLKLSPYLLSVGHAGSVDARQYRLPRKMQSGDLFSISFILQINPSISSGQPDKQLPSSSSCRLKINQIDEDLSAQQESLLTDAEKTDDLVKDYTQYNNYLSRRRKPKAPRRSSYVSGPRKGQQREVHKTNIYSDYYPVEENQEEKVENSHPIDISKDREVFKEVQKSGTNEINCVWSDTFVVFFVVEVVFITLFVVFGLTMFVLLQVRSIFWA